MGGDRSEASLGFGEECLDLRTPAVQPPGTHQRTATVAARTGHDGDVPVDRVACQKAPPGQVSEGTPGILHHLDQFYAEVFDHGPVHLDHLLGSQVGDLAPVDPNLRHGARLRYSRACSSPTFSTLASSSSA